MPNKRSDDTFWYVVSFGTPPITPFLSSGGPKESPDPLSENRTIMNASEKTNEILLPEKPPDQKTGHPEHELP
ncbi:MAG: hypothetical protein ABI718_17465 [Acidobacteriota bacterium]